MEINESPVVITIRNGLKALPKRWKDMPSANIFRAPEYIREGRRDVYEPTSVSIGPYSRHCERLKHMQEHKWQCLREFLAVGGIMDTTLVKAMEDVAPDARKCYPQSAPLGTTDEFVEMLLLDGCFIIDVLIKSMLGRRQYMPTTGWNFPHIMADLLKLENQIPFCVVLKLYEILGKTHSPLPGNRTGLLALALNYLKPDYNLMGLSVKIPDGKVHHLLHLYHLINVPIPKQLQPDPKFSDPFCGPLFSALESCLQLQTKESPGRAAGNLVESGVTIKARKLGSHFLDITFHNGTLEIPCQFIDPSFKAILTNILLFEQHSEDPNKYWTAYANFLDDLINSQVDIVLLERSGVIKNSLSSPDELITFIHQLVPNITLDPKNCEIARYLDDLTARMERYCQSKWNKWMAKVRVTWNEWMAKLERDYFSNPWSAISVLAAIVLLALTILQTVYTMKSYLQPPK